MQIPSLNNVKAWILFTK